MKRILVVCAANLLSCFLVSAQEADNSGAGVELSVIPKFEIMPSFVSGHRDGEITLGSSSLYSLFEGNISENLSFSVSNHWASFYALDASFLDPTADLYKNSFLTAESTWLDWAYLSYEPGPFSVSFGKMTAAIGGYEFDEYDFDMHYALASNLWANYQPYQWGARLGYTLPDGENSFYLEILTSPFSDKSFYACDRFSYGLSWRGALGPVGTIWSASLIQSGKNEYIPAVSLGQQVEFGDFTCTLDLSNVTAPWDLCRGLNVHPRLNWAPADNFEFLASVCYERVSDDSLSDPDVLSFGAAAHWFPLKDNKDLRVHLTAGYSEEVAFLTLGAVWHLNLIGR